jgi:nucleoside-diphosphate-sugar epimerase
MEDASNRTEMRKIFNLTQPDYVVFLAGTVEADPRHQQPRSAFSNTLGGLENILSLSREQVKHFIFISSAKVYGELGSMQVSEEENCNPLDVAGTLKFAGEKMLKAYNDVFGMPFTIIRSSDVYGEGCVSRQICQRFIESAMRGKELKIMENGLSRLDFTYVQDLVEGVTNCLGNPKALGEIFNMSGGQPASLNDLITILMKHFDGLKAGYELQDRLVPVRGGLSIAKAKEMLGYQPQYSLEKGMERYISWYRRTDPFFGAQSSSLHLVSAGLNK